jgi:hypothetical protein
VSKLSYEPNKLCEKTVIVQNKLNFLWKDRVFAIRAKAHWLERCGTDLCVNINR